MTEALLSPKSLADALGVSESSVKRWVDAGDLVARKTAGGHRRIERGEAIRFARKCGIEPMRPELLALVPAREGDTAETARSSAFHDALLDGDRVRAVGLLHAAYMQGESVASICDGPVREALAQVGELWKHDENGILVEHRATEICRQALASLRDLLPTVADDAPVAVGSAGPDDPYWIPNTMCSMTVAEAGLRDVNLGPHCPVTTKLTAVRMYKPCLVWHSASVKGREVDELAAGLAASKTADAPRLVVGGRAISRAALPEGVEYLSSMRELQAFARAHSKRVGEDRPG